LALTIVLTVRCLENGNTAGRRVGTWSGSMEMRNEVASLDSLESRYLLRFLALDIMISFEL